MQYKSQYNLSSANIFIEMPVGHPVGYITDLNISTNMNQQQIKNLRSEGIQSYVKGFTVNSVSASRAIIDGETFFGNYQTIIDYYTNAGNLLRTSSNLTSNITTSDPILAAISSAGKTAGSAFDLGVASGNIIDYRELIESGEKLIKNKISLAEFWAKIPFSIVAKTQAPENTKYISLDNFLNTGRIGSQMRQLWRIDNCSLNSRSIKFSTSDVVVMENLEVFSTSFSDYSFVSDLVNNGFKLKF